MQHFSIKQCSSKLQGDFSDQQFSRFCSQKVSKWQQESNQFVVKNFNQESQIRVQFTIFQSFPASFWWFYCGKLVNRFLFIYYLRAIKKGIVFRILYITILFSNAVLIFLGFFYSIW